MISLHSNMTQYYVKADGILQSIVMMEDAQKKTMLIGMPITDIELGNDGLGCHPCCPKLPMRGA
jgi:hypothetical protein